MSFYVDEMVRIEDAELFLLGASASDLGYEALSLQMGYDVLEIDAAREAIRKGKMPRV